MLLTYSNVVNKLTVVSISYHLSIDHDHIHPAACVLIICNNNKFSTCSDVRTVLNISIQKGVIILKLPAKTERKKSYF
jgi:hypothetical protein